MDTPTWLMVVNLIKVIILGYVTNLEFWAKVLCRNYFLVFFLIMTLFCFVLLIRPKYCKSTVSNIIPIFLSRLKGWIFQKKVSAWLCFKVVVPFQKNFCSLIIYFLIKYAVRLPFRNFFAKKQTKKNEKTHNYDIKNK